MGAYMAKVFAGERTWLHPALRPLEKAALPALRHRRNRTSSAGPRYAGGVLVFSVVSLLLTYVLMRVQQWLPLNPQGLGNVEHDLSFNTAASFTTNTNWQAYTPETTMSYFTEMLGLATHNFFSAAAGHRGGHRLRARLCAPLGRRPWAISGWTSRAPFLRAAAALDRGRAGCWSRRA